MYVVVTGATDPDCDGSWLCEWSGSAELCEWTVNQSGTTCTLQWTGDYQIQWAGNCNCGPITVAAATCNSDTSGAGCGGVVTVYAPWRPIISPSPSPSPSP